MTAAVVGSIVAGIVVVAVIALVAVAVRRRAVASAAAGGPGGLSLSELAGVSKPPPAPTPPASAVSSVPTTTAPTAPTAPRHSAHQVADAGAIVFGADSATTARTRRREALPQIRRAEPADAPRLAEIEAQSDPGLDGSGLGALPAPALRDGEQAASVLLVAGRPAVAFIRVDEVDGVAHIDQLAVLSSAARQGIGRALLDAAIAWAARNGYPAMTLSTFAESEWNARVYDPTGFTPIANLSPGLRELRDWERAIGLDAIGARVVMRRDLPA
jgi:ribosomal protein S18 acetylase RimI-like enzyme